MEELNRILLQLNRAVECANSRYPQEKGTAVILFDNLIEVLLYKKAEISLLLDDTTWIGGVRRFKKGIRNNVIGQNGKYGQLLSFCLKNNIVDDDDYVILRKVHGIRNNIYHRGEVDELKSDFAIIAYYNFLLKKLNIWGSPSAVLCFSDGTPSSEVIDFGQGIVKNKVLINHEDYFISAWTYLLGKLSFSLKPQEYAALLINRQIISIRDNLKSIQDNMKTINFYNVLSRYWYLNNEFSDWSKQSRRPRNLDSILLIYAFLREHKDELDDIPNLVDRQELTRKLLKKYRYCYKGKYPYWADLDKIESRVKNFNKKDEKTVLKNLIEIEERLSLLYLDTNEAAFDLDGYIQFSVDDWLGK